jgi:tryptophan synthase alpha chain
MDDDVLISKSFKLLGSEGRTALIPYVTAGYPNRDATVPLLERLKDVGADIIELGIPFSDPLADGPTIQRSSFAALENGTTVASILADLRTFRDGNDLPIVLFSYLNPILAYGLEAFLSDAVTAGADGILLTDLPTGADPELEAKISESPLALIRLIAPTTPFERVPKVTYGGSGFVYYISRTGVTGARVKLRESLAEELGQIRSVVSLPVAVGFGISTPEQAASVAGVADGVVIGSALIEALDKGGIDGGADFLHSIRIGMDRG